jgi:hypothetical protein
VSSATRRTANPQPPALRKILNPGNLEIAIIDWLHRSLGIL